MTQKVVSRSTPLFEKGEKMADKNEFRVRNRYFEAILYEEDKNYNNYKDYIIKNYKEVTWIKHNRDIIEDKNGEEKKKKEHIHIIFKVGQNARSIKSVAKEIGIADNYLQGIKLIPMLRYLIHLDNPEKTQYELNEVHGELKEKLEKEIEKTKEDEITIEEITNKIKEGDITRVIDLITYGIENKALQKIKKYQYLLIKSVEENRIYEYKKLLSRKRRRDKGQMAQSEDANI